MLSNRLTTQPETNGFSDVVKLKENFDGQCNSNGLHYGIGKKRDSGSMLNKIGVSKRHGRKERMSSTNSKGDEPASKRSSNNFIGGYVRRLAAKNASACVNAMLESPKKSGNTTKGKKLDSDGHSKINISTLEANSGILEGKRMARKRRNAEDLPIELHQKRSNSDIEMKVASFGRTLSQNKVFKSDINSDHDDFSSSSEDSVSSENVVTSTRSSPSCNYPDRFFEYCDDFPYSLVGLLYNGDCIHTDSKYYLKSDSNTIKNRIIPCVIPSNKDDLTSLKDRFSDSEKHKAQKGDNGWSPVGSPIKTINIIVEKGKRIQRKYFIGIRRKKDTLFARDSVLLRSGSRKEDVPFIAKISSIWQEPGSRLMVTVFWYYRKEDTDSSSSDHFMDMEVMASQHHDDISVACIDDKCHVLGLSEFYRFMAKLERLPKLKEARSTQSISKLKQGIVKFNLHQQDPQFRELVESEVYLCFRAYNHIAGKILKI